MKPIPTITRIKPYSSRTQQAYSEGWKTCAEMNDLRIKGRGGEIIDEVRREFKRAVYYKFNKLAAEFSTYLMYYYYNLKGEKRRGNKYSRLSLHYSNLSHMENIAAGKFAAIVFKLNKSRNPDAELTNELTQICKEFRAYLKYDSAQIWIFSYMLFNKLAYIKKDTRLMISQCYEVINYLEERGIERTASFWKDITPALILEGRYDEAEDTIGKAISGINKGSLSWSVFVYYRTMIELHRGNYQRAYEIFQIAEKKRQINIAIKDTWNIVKAYMKFLVTAGKVDGIANFKVGKFFNNIEVFSSDKTGQNINIIILKIILRLDSDRGQIVDERETIQRYAEKYLEVGSRPRVFLQMLHQLAPADFNREKVEARVRKNVGELRRGLGWDPDMEMVPYEDLWELVLDGLS